ncbi:MAG: cytochrome c [Lewinellaceae bacterium]|nr:cytochrome c [Lewinellaceae bacterium]
MKKNLVALSLFVGLTLLALPSGCYYDNEEDLYGPVLLNCDTTNIRFGVEIKQIFEQNCNACHTTSGSSYSLIPFETHAQIEAVAKNGKLLNRINSQSAPMPQTGLMSLCNRAKIEAWVRTGALDN